MKLKKDAETFNLGDTSFRRQALIDDYKVLLSLLQKVNLEYPEWDKEAQEKFYETVLEETNMFSRNEEEDFARRGRTLTSALAKIGLINDRRRLSRVANNWLSNSNLASDEVEGTLGIDINNLMFTRQLLKLRIYHSDGIRYFHPVRVALELVKRYRNIPQRNFLILIHSIQPNFDDLQIEGIITAYESVASNKETFPEFLDREFPENESDVTARELFSSRPLDRDKFDLLFTNRKSSSTQDVYFDFVTSLIKFKECKTQENFARLIEFNTDAKLKRAFGFGKSVFKKADNVNDFLKKNEGSRLLSEDDTFIYEWFVFSKKYDLVKEYGDMTKRTLNLSGLFDFRNGLVNATSREIFKIIFTNMRFSGEDKYSDYEKNLNYFFYQESTITTILNLDKDEKIQAIKELLNVTDYSQIQNAVASQKEKKFREFISEVFPRKKIMELLPLFSKRDDKKIKSAVSESATVPTIYEYIVAIAWFYISKEDFSITQSLNLTLDGNMLPLSHAAGGAGDIVINYENLTLMLEVTLMNKQAQKRGEWEPVLRHATNLTVDNSSKNVTTLFIADELDENTINIWRAVASVPLKSSNKDEFADLVKIFPLENKELLDMLKNNRDEVVLLKAIDKSYTKFAGDFDLGWRDEILDCINNK
ncbi:AlwI family type II restriction endonuclease [Ligilactobacillus animalis]|uniref:AlwI family type II restriction endonuclease n=1 Tax=Ligilactobacillus animalis TaxID=1605 RepID=UPI0027CB5AEC|nr:AlwI family type II restriction endonuclease [Ligilactobacillus animalis]MDQ2234563.1 AlwI family type II restriction endonuclease [Ligilactobacillus animalis]